MKKYNHKLLEQCQFRNNKNNLTVQYISYVTEKQIFVLPADKCWHSEPERWHFLAWTGSWGSGLKF
jgi:hypothetical protein